MKCYDLVFASRIIDGVNIVTMDTYYRLTDEQTARLKREVERGYPVLLAMHVPFYTETVDTAARICYN